MKKYSVFKLYVVRQQDNYFICEKSNDNVYIEIFTKEKIKVINEENVKPLKNYYSLLAIRNYTTGEPLLLTKKALLLKYAQINSSNIEIKKQSNNSYENFIRGQKECIEALVKLKEENPEKAKEIAIQSLQKTGIIDENPYDLFENEAKNENECNFQLKKNKK